METNKIKLLKKQLDEMNVDEVIRREVKPFGTSAHVVVGKRHKGKKTITLVLKKENGK